MKDVDMSMLTLKQYAKTYVPKPMLRLLFKMFGAPVLQLSEMRKSEFVERLWYNTTSGQIANTLIDGKVAPLTSAVKKPEAKPSAN